ncbi:Swt1 family HEPN domain-containing protein [Pantoea sp. GM01]|uniref:Swt1 family HEPN domain-containing protein n=1 Tax=Pantoea sp. GM01 TaxID=1144320 RepID=UPI000270F80A|nr:Swt1 family HEPN domain-containing protein [Pantoea sp. GM01]EJL93238.1 hypothetical protein PMI17_00507 [Pantoea sp. GM01]
MLSELEKISDRDERSIVLYARLWQFEKWLREMVYVELKSKKGRNWFNLNKIKNTYETDKAFTHIPTTNNNPLSFITFPDLLKLIDKDWDLFSEYLPPQNIWKIKIDEIIHIRNRVAHFRNGHRDDVDRLLQLMKDIDKGFWRFCTDYNDIHPILPPERDAVANKYVHLDPFAYKEISDNQWARLGTAPRGLKYILSVNSSRRRWSEKSAEIADTPGHIYDVIINLRDNWFFNYPKALKELDEFKDKLIHVCMDSLSKEIRVTIPAVIGTDEVCSIIDRMIEIAVNSLTLCHSTDDARGKVQKISEDWPEHVLGPDNPLTYLGPDMPCDFFNITKN